MVRHRNVAAGDLRLRIAEEGEGPLVLLLHGFPECWYSWRHQFAPLAGAGYHVLAPHQRGYGRRNRPAEVEEYTILHLVGDAVGLIRALGEQQAAAEFGEAGLTGPLNWYRNFDRNWELTAAWDGAQYQMPGRYLTGDRDLIYRFPRHGRAGPGPAEVNAALLTFLGALTS
jgi:alpha/beta hydrolase fold